MIAVYIDNDLNKFRNEIQYTFNFIFNTLGYEFKFIKRLDQLLENDILFFYGLIEPTIKEAYILALNKIIFFIPADVDLLQLGMLKKEKIKEYTHELKLIQKIPIISKKEFRCPVHYYQKEDLFYGLYNFDVIGNIFFNLIGYDEINCAVRDRYNRVPDSEISLPDYHLTPYINVILWLIERCIKDSIEEKKTYFLLKKDYWPNAESFAVVISHNVDRLQKWSLSSIIKSIFEDILVFYKVKYVINNLISKIKYILTNIEEYWNFELIDEIENHHMISSTFFFGTESESALDIDYSIKDNDVYKEVMNNLNKGNEIALLGSYNSCKNDILERQKNRICQITGEDKIGIRHNFNRFDPQITTEFHKKNGFIYDSSRGFNKKIGFKYGIGFPYHLFSLNGNSKAYNNKYLEVPLVFSDETLKLSRTKNVPYEKAKILVDEIIESIESVNGVITFNFSVSNFTDISYNKDLFSFILDNIKPKNVFQGTFIEIANWWRKRDSVEVEEKEDEISVYFPENMERITVSLIGNYEILEVEGSKPEIKSAKLLFSNIKADTMVRIRLKKINID
ncbi:MAG: hypothetical protein KAU01_12745 [Candidatus Cloacimonetes bacterium]|nr:hypothetical protein [Candidatus Cloacimonadota bacterium]